MEQKLPLNRYRFSMEKQYAGLENVETWETEAVTVEEAVELFLGTLIQTDPDTEDALLTAAVNATGNLSFDLNHPYVYDETSVLQDGQVILYKDISVEQIDTKLSEAAKCVANCLVGSTYLDEADRILIAEGIAQEIAHRYTLTEREHIPERANEAISLVTSETATEEDWARAIARRLCDEPIEEIAQQCAESDDNVAEEVSSVWREAFEDTWVLDTPMTRQRREEAVASYLLRDENTRAQMELMKGTYVIEEDYFDALI